MAGGIAGKSTALVQTALAKVGEAERNIQQEAQRGNVGVLADKVVTDASIVAAITALQAIQ